MSALLERILGRPLYAADPETGTAAPTPTPEPQADPDAGVRDFGDFGPPEPEESEEGAEEAQEEEAPVEAAPEPVDDGTEDLELNGKKFKIPREIRPLLMTQADYTQKTQELAQQRAALADHFEQQSVLANEKVAKAGQFAHANEMLAKYQQLDWNALRTQDPELAQTRLIEWKQWESHREKISQEFAGLQAQEAQARQTQVLEAQNQLQMRLQENQAILHRDIPNWKEVGPKVGEYATSKHGFTPQELGSVPDARFVKVLHEAYLYGQLMEKQKAAAQQRTQPKAAAAEPIAPLATVTPKSGGPTARKSLEDLAKGDNMNAFVETYRKTFPKHRH